MFSITRRTLMSSFSSVPRARLYGSIGQVYHSSLSSKFTPFIARKTHTGNGRAFLNLVNCPSFKKPFFSIINAKPTNIPLNLQSSSFVTRRWYRGAGGGGPTWRRGRGKTSQGWNSSSPSSSLSPFTRFQMLLQQVPEDRLMKLMIGTNIGVFILWQTVGARSLQGQRFMTNHFCISLKNLMEGRIHTLLTASFSQQGFMHLLVNCITLYFFGGAILQSLGAVTFMTVYITGGIMSGVSHMIYQNIIVPLSRNVPLNTRMLRSGYFDVPARGASGSVQALAVLMASMNPHAQLTMFLLFIPITLPAWLAVGGFVAYDVIQTMGGSRDGVSHAGHIGGAAYGALYYLFKIR